MSEPLDSWERAVAFALTLPGAVMGSSYGQPAVCSAQGRAFLHAGHEAETSFVLALDRDTVAILLETDPESFWQTTHYVGWGAVLVRFGSPDPERVRAMIAEAHAQASATPKPRPRKRRAA